MLPKIDHKQLLTFLDLSYKTRQPLLITGPPGIGKTIALMDYCKVNDIDLLVSHPVISDPSDFRGLPARTTRVVKMPDDSMEAMLGEGSEVQNIAEFLPFGDLLQAIDADRPMIWFFDDMGQAPMSVQAACMQIIGGRRIGDRLISDQVRIMAATNRREDKAGVKGLLEPVKSRFGMIVELTADRDSFVSYAYKNNFEQSIVDFINYTPGALHDFKPNLGMENSPNPRLWEKLSILLSEYCGKDKDILRSICTSCIGETYGAQFYAFSKVYNRLPTYEDIIADADDYPLDQKPDVRAAMLGMLANRGKVEHAHEVFMFINRLAKEYQVLFMRAVTAMDNEIRHSGPAQLWTAENMDVFLD